MNEVTLSKELAYECANALVDKHNALNQEGSVRLLSFRSLYEKLTRLGFSNLIANAIKPTDYPNDMWWPKQRKEGQPW